jgi:hypothetical protein
VRKREGRERKMDDEGKSAPDHLFSNSALTWAKKSGWILMRAALLRIHNKKE